MQDFDATLGIFSESNFLTEKLREKFNGKYIDVKVFSDFKKVNTSEFNYLIINMLDDNYDFNEIVNVIANLKCKILALLPLSVPKSDKVKIEKEIDNLISLNPNLGVVLVPEILGATVKYVKNYVSHDIIMQSLLSERIKIKSEGKLINTISTTKLVERIFKETLSFGIVGQRLALIGPKRGAKTFAVKYLKLSDDNIVSLRGDDGLETIKYDFASNVDFSIRLAVKNTRQSFSNTINSLKEPEIVESEPSKENVTSKIKDRKPFNIKQKIKLKTLGRLILLVTSIYLLPLILILISTLLLFVSSKYMLSSNNFSQRLISGSSKMAIFASQVSFNNNFYYSLANIVQKTSNLASETLTLSKTGSEFISLMLGDNIYDVNFYANNVSASLDKVHTNISFLQSDIAELSPFFENSINNYLAARKIDIKDLKLKVLATKNLASRLLVLLGSEKQMKYLVLFQNNMELRPTGGFIGSYAILTAEKGRIAEIVVSDIYSADGQLKGHVDPPEPIREHLGEGGWYMRDANWDPDFVESSKKIEWFLDKEINEQVDGVVAIDLNFVKSLLNITGPILLSDFNKTINSENLYTETQSEVEDDFFAGSIKKASFLTSLSKSLITEIQNLPSEKNLSLFKEVFNNLEQRHIQIYLHDKNAQEALSTLGFTGEVDMNTECGLRCFNDKYMLVDANLGVNKANYYIKRSQELNTTVFKNKINHELLVNYENTANIAVGQSGKYKTYTRLVVPTNAVVKGVREYNNDGSYNDLALDEEVINGRKEIGFLVEVSPSLIKPVQLVWDIPTDVFQNGGEYNLKVIKQSGTEKDKLKVVLRENDLSLTGKVDPVYNTDLLKDFRLKVFYK